MSDDTAPRWIKNPVIADEVGVRHCDLCFYYADGGGGDGYGECRQKPAVVVDDVTTRWPVVPALGWCGAGAWKMSTTTEAQA